MLSKKGIKIENSYKSIRNGAIGSTIVALSFLFQAYVIMQLAFMGMVWLSLRVLESSLSFSYSLPGWLLLIISLLALFAIMCIFDYQRK